MINDEKCKHDWVKMRKQESTGLFDWGKIEYDILYCSKCQSTMRP